ncbi:Ku protein [Candidatus Binatia bacterium]|jgi:DNA end-binding protein Ku|nr:Ku protein [Candidatus Binatia bacterium]
MARAIWSGQLSFGLVTIPVGLHAALEAAERVHFHQLHRKDLAPIRYRKFCSRENREVPSSEIVRGYEVSKGRYAVVEAEELDEVQKELGEGERTIEILQFVDAKALDPLLFEKPYYVTPAKGGAKAYGVLRRALDETGKVGIARFYMRTRPLLAALVPSSGILSLEVMRSAAELRDPRKLAVKELAAKPAEVKMAATLIEQMTERWDPAAHPNAYRKAVEKLIEGKPKFDVGEGAAAKPAGKVVDLMQALKDSLKGDAKKTTKPRKKSARARKAA